MLRRSSDAHRESGASGAPSEGMAEQEAADLEACRDLLRKGSKSFAAAALLLPKRVREPATALYAFCRVADDAIDTADRAPDALARLQERLALAYRGTPLPSPVDRAFARAAEEHRIPRELMEALLEGFAWDAEGRRYESLAALQAYAARVAGTVGAMMTVLMGPREATVLARACDLGVAMQLTNIARDVGQDAREGRLYLPLDWLDEAGVDAAEFMARPAFSPALGGVVARLIRRADELYVRADLGIAMLPHDCWAAIHAARMIYAEIGRSIERAGFDSVSRRAVVPLRRKLWLLVRALIRASAKSQDGEALSLHRVAGDRSLLTHASRSTSSSASMSPLSVSLEASAPPLEETQFLVDAAALPEVSPARLLSGEAM